MMNSSEIENIRDLVNRELSGIFGEKPNNVTFETELNNSMKNYAEEGLEKLISRMSDAYKKITERHNGMSEDDEKKAFKTLFALVNRANKNINILREFRKECMAQVLNELGTAKGPVVQKITESLMGFYNEKGPRVTMNTKEQFKASLIQEYEESVSAVRAKLIINRITAFPSEPGEEKPSPEGSYMSINQG